MRFASAIAGIFVVSMGLSFAPLCYASPDTVQNTNPSQTPVETNSTGLVAGECDLSAGSCSDSYGIGRTIGPGMAISTTNGTCAVTDCIPGFDAAKSPAGVTSPRMAIDAFNYCRYVENGSGDSIFVPFRSKLEWGTGDSGSAKHLAVRF